MIEFRSPETGTKEGSTVKKALGMLLDLAFEGRPTLVCLLAGI